MTRHQFVEAPTTWTACIAPHANEPERPRAAQHGLLCAGHYSSLQQALSELPACLTEAERALVRSANAGPKISGSPEKPLPFNEQASDALISAHAVLVSWTSLILEEHPSGLHAPIDDSFRLAQFLYRHLDWCAEQPWVDDLLRELRELRIHLRHAANPRRVRRVPLGLCRDIIGCDLNERIDVECTGTLTALIREADELLPNVIFCDTCGGEYSADRWPALGRRLMGSTARFLTYEQISEVLRGDVSLRTLKRWNSEDGWGQGEPVAGRKTFQLEDAQRSFETRRAKESA